MDSVLSNFLDAPRSVKRVVTLLFDIIALSVCAGISFWVVNEFVLNITSKEIIALFLSNVLSLFVFIQLGFYRAILRYIGFQSIYTIFSGILLSGIFFSFALFLSAGRFNLLQILIYCFCLLVVIGGSRLAFKSYIERISKKLISKVAIYGAGASGRQLASALKHGDKYRTALFIDDDLSLQQSEIDGVKVIDSIDLSVQIKKMGITHIFLAVPSANNKQRSKILDKLEPLPIKVKTIAGLEDIVTGKVKIEELKELDIEDLLGRESVTPQRDLLESCIKNKVVMVTGAGGSIGSELCRQIIQLRPKAILLYELSEYALYLIESELTKLCKKMDKAPSILGLLGSVQNKERLLSCMKAKDVETVYHAAAYKHVPIVEHNVAEGLRNNIFGTLMSAQAAIEAKVKNFVLISTDKAVRPTNVMGATKRVAELILQALNSKTQLTIFTMVRFGNVLGSSGSVVPLFREQIKNGGPVTVTHPDIIRYFMTIPEAAQLVIQAGTMAKGGDVFVLEMGEPVKIVELAKKLISLMGAEVKDQFNPNGDVEIKFSGLRPGEKLYEELLVGNNVEGTIHSRIMTANEKFLPWEELTLFLEKLESACNKNEHIQIRQILQDLPTDFSPADDISDLLWKESYSKKSNVISI